MGVVVGQHRVQLILQLHPVVPHHAALAPTVPAADGVEDLDAGQTVQRQGVAGDLHRAPVRVRQPDRAPLLVDVVDYHLRRQPLRVHVLADVETDEVMSLAAERVRRMQLRTRDEDEVVRSLDRLHPCDRVVVGETEEPVVPLHVPIEPLLG